MVNFGLNSASILGIFLAVAGAALYFLRSVRPELARDHDIFFAAVGLLCGFILLFQGWRLDPILQFGQFLLTGSAIFFGFESVRMRGIATEQAKRDTPIVEDDRPVSRVYRAEFDEIEPMEERPVTRRIRGTQDSRSSRETYEDEPRRRPSSRGTQRPSSTERSSETGTGISSRTRKTSRRPRPESRPTEQPGGWEVTDTWEDKPSRPSRPEGRPTERIDDWQATDTWEEDKPIRTSRPESRPTEETDDWQSTNTWEEDKPIRTSRPSSTRSPRRDSEGSTKPKRTRPPRESSRPPSGDVEATPTDYVEYKPIDFPDDEGDNSGNFA
ncbi:MULTISPECIES: Ycf66 family protein [Cyanophyceae]|uniref:Ycf66 family protein n=1 Tax=Cyanophyceae TaxID=3028117 RepID=UPI001684F276|nr:hypothetical protein [Trichocoleus sp. FACHB-40]